LAVNVTLLPEQRDAELADAVTVGVVVTLKVITSIPVQLALSPVTVYVVVEEGLSIVEAVIAPELQEYVAAPDAVNVALLPEQIEELLAEATTVGVVVTLKVTTSLPKHPVFSPVTV
jgi:hypothetical protein